MGKQMSLDTIVIWYICICFYTLYGIYMLNFNDFSNIDSGLNIEFKINDWLSSKIIKPARARSAGFLQIK